MCGPVESFSVQWSCKMSQKCHLKRAGDSSGGERSDWLAGNHLSPRGCGQSLGGGAGLEVADSSPLCILELEGAQPAQMSLFVWLCL
jgi:hypothetical protein